MRKKHSQTADYVLGEARHSCFAADVLDGDHVFNRNTREGFATGADT